VGGSLYNWCVYMIWSSRLDVYYTGVTTDLVRRLRQHNEGKGAKFTRGRGPWVRAKNHWVKGKSAALKLEREWKKLSHAEKVRMHSMECSPSW